MNTAKINLEVTRCLDCPYCRKPDGYPAFHCVHDLHSPGIEVGEGEVIPDFCPFVLERLGKIMKTIEGCSNVTIPRRFVTEIERRQRDDPDPKFGADHAWSHIKRVTEFGEDFLEHLVAFGYVSPNSVQKEKKLFEIAAFLHDIGLADTKFNHAIHSAELAKKYFANPKNDISEEDAEVIVHAVCNHSDGKETRTVTDAVLLIADKLDITKDRVNRSADVFLAEIMKIESADFRFYGEHGKAERAELRYTTTTGINFDISILKRHAKVVSVPMKVTQEFFKVPEFKFFINNREVDLKEFFR